MIYKTNKDRRYSEKEGVARLKLIHDKSNNQCKLKSYLYNHYPVLLLFIVIIIMLLPLYFVKDYIDCTNWSNILGYIGSIFSVISAVIISYYQILLSRKRNLKDKTIRDISILHTNYNFIWTNTHAIFIYNNQVEGQLSNDRKINLLLINNLKRVDGKIYPYIYDKIYASLTPPIGIHVSTANSFNEVINSLLDELNTYQSKSNIFISDVSKHPEDVKLLKNDIAIINKPLYNIQQTIRRLLPILSKFILQLSR